MNMTEMEKTVRANIQAWLEQDAEAFAKTFAGDAVYIECYGPEYRGLAQIMHWFRDWNRRGRVLAWTVKRYWESGSTAIYEWNFDYVLDGVPDAFDGVTLADFDAEGRIMELREFQSRAEHYHPFE